MPVLTDAAVRKYAPHRQRREIPDTRAPGLYLIVQPSGVKSWALRFRRPDGRPGKLTLGRVDLGTEEPSDEPAFGGALTLRAARELANRVDRERARGIDVIAQRQADKHRARAAEVDRSKNTFLAAAMEFFRDHRVRKWRTLPREWRREARVLGLHWPRYYDDPSKSSRRSPRGVLLILGGTNR